MDSGECWGFRTVAFGTLSLLLQMRTLTTEDEHKVPRLRRRVRSGSLGMTMIAYFFFAANMSASVRPHFWAVW